MKRLVLLFSIIIILHGCSPTPNKGISTIEKNDSPTNSNIDSSLLSSLIKNAKLSLIDYEDTLGSKSEDDLDSLLRNYNGGCCDGKIFYTPDSLYKIFTIKGESCGMYCNPFWEYNIYSNKNKEISGDPYSNLFKDIISIHKLPDEKYLVLQEEYGRPASVLSVSCRIASIISIKNDSLICYPVLRNTYDDNIMKDFYNEKTGLTFCQEHYVSAEEPSINFNPHTNELNYKFGRNYTYCCQMDTDSLITGTLMYDKSEFKIKEYKIEFLKPENKE